ncbi:ATP-dependent endonuclease [Methanoregula sp.]|uniref:ATP-dependent nuclease n=1 Tax=Methanoregula sp. TaxID=2052170 RepID=UPI0026053431|nr:ATP-dependent endonuclease [Methanoregula sp.]MDD5142402.1 ATP-dependent endonuclease [Methanoregula sp.]
MRIQKVKIRNYRSICSLEVLCEPEVILLGPNNHGKSNILSAIEFALTPSAKPQDEDLNAFCGEDYEIWVELTFHELSEQEKNTFKKYLRNDGTFLIRKTAKKSQEGKIETEYRGSMLEPEQSWLKESEIRNLASRDAINPIPLREYVPAAGRITQDMVKTAQSQYIEEHRAELIFHENLTTTNFLGPKNIGGGSLPDFYIIPAVRDLSDETRIKNTTMFGKLLGRTIQEMAERDPQYQQLCNGIEQLVKRLNRSDADPQNRPTQMVDLETRLSEELRDWGVSVEIEVIPPEIEKIFELGTNLSLDDGVKTLAEQKGHGLQRAVIFAIFRAWAKTLRSNTQPDAAVPRASSDSLIFAIEEPELFLHPQAQRKMAQALQEIAVTPQHQVLICSHSSHFVDLEKYRSICIISKENPRDGTSVRQCSKDLFEGTTHQDRKKKFHAAHWINPDRGEMFFAKKVVFVEGETEKVIFPFLADKMGCFKHDVSIIDCGSKHNLPMYIAIANAFNLKHVVVHDEDPLPSTIPPDWNPDKIREKTKTFELNHEIATQINPDFGIALVITKDFEQAAGISLNQVDKKGKALAAVDFFGTKGVDEIPIELKSIVTEIYS